jgi:choline dehydrogenase-like flavoprotein
MNLNIDAVKEVTYDAIVVGSGISGGWAAKELTQKGLKVLMLERGRDIKHVSDYETALKNPWDFPHRGRLSVMAAEEYWAVARTGYAANEQHRYLFENDSQNPYIEKRPFDWVRAYHTGGKSLLWGRQSYRWNKEDFEANAKDGHGVDWPIRYEDIAPWYTYVEKFAGISGQAEGLDVLPDSHFLPPMAMFAPEKYMKEQVSKKMGGRPITIGRTAHLTSPQAHHTALGRASCQFRDMCMRGCPYGGYFSTQSATLPAAMKTGRLTLQNDAIVSEIIYDEQKQRAKGVRVINQHTLEVKEYFSKIIFVNAGAIGSTSLLMNSKSNRFQTGLGNDSDQLGRNIMDHHLGVGAGASIEGFEDDYYYGRRPSGLYIPRFANWGKDKKRDYVRGFGYQGGASRGGWGRGVGMDGFGADFKESMTEPGGWGIGFSGFGEVVPNENNRFTLDPVKKDKWGLPVLVFDADLGENEMKMRKDMANEMAEMLDASGFKNVNIFDNGSHLGLGIHEMGTARMGKDPKTSVLNKFNQVHTVKNVFVTDGAAMASASCVNPSLTYMALTARAANHAVSELKKHNL